MGIEVTGKNKEDMAWQFFDKNLNREKDPEEIRRLNSSIVIFDMERKSISITTPDKKTTTLDNMGIWKGDEFYKTGSIEVAVIDDMRGLHGITVTNILKKDNPNLSISTFNNMSDDMLNPLQKLWKNLFEKIEENPAFQNFILRKENDNLRKIYSSIYESMLPEDLTLKRMSYALDNVSKEMKNGKNFKAVNMSFSVDMTYSDINKLCRNEIGEEITPENIAKHRMKIKEILERTAKENKDLDVFEPRYGGVQKLSNMVEVLKKTENLKIPAYIAQCYVGSGQEVVNILALADNAIPVGSPAEGVSNNSLGTKKEVAVHFVGDEVTVGSTSFATPVVMARELREKK